MAVTEDLCNYRVSEVGRELALHESELKALEAFMDRIEGEPTSSSERPAPSKCVHELCSGGVEVTAFPAVHAKRSALTCENAMSSRRSRNGFIGLFRILVTWL